MRSGSDSLASLAAVATRTGSVRLRDGRAFAYAEWGPADGWPLLHCHGIPDGRFRWGGGPICTDRGVRLIAIDRPGIGGSDPMLGRSVADWPADVEELLDQLEVDRFAISGWSAGGAYALACAHALAPRIDAVALVSGVGPIYLPGYVEQMSTAAAWRLVRRAPAAMTLAYSALGRLARHSPRTAQKAMFAGLPRVDKAIVDQPEVGARLMSAYIEATRRTSAGLTEDMRVLLRPWGFDPSGINLPVHIIHGRQDTIVPPRHAEHWIATLPHTQPIWVQGTGHFLIERHVAQILDALAP